MSSRSVAVYWLETNLNVGLAVRKNPSHKQNVLFYGVPRMREQAKCEKTKIRAIRE